MAKFKHIKYTKLSPILSETQYLPSGVAILSRVGKHPRAASAVLAMAVFLSVIGIDFVRSRHLVFN